MSSLLAKITLICAGLGSVLLGAHGLYVYCYSKLGSYLGTPATGVSLSSEEQLSRLFLSWGVPNPFGELVLWATTRGLESWVVPAALLVGGFLLLRVQKLCKVHA